MSKGFSALEITFKDEPAQYVKAVLSLMPRHCHCEHHVGRERRELDLLNAANSRPPAHEAREADGPPIERRMLSECAFFGLF
jgi:hypothetical protein